MPLFRIDMFEGRSDKDLRKLLDVLHACATEAFGLPAGDRFQIVNEHKPGRMILEDVGLNMVRSDQVVVIQITTTPRGLSSRKAFYATASARLTTECGLRAEDLMINMITTSESDWSFGRGVAQFLNGDL